MTRRLIRPTRNAFKVGQFVTIDADAAGTFRGVVTEVHVSLARTVSSYDDTIASRPGVTVRVMQEEGFDLHPADWYEIIAWDSEATRWERAA